MILAKGAEATLTSESKTVTKIRHPKSYRLDVLDRKLRRFRTKREAKVLQRLGEAEFCSPRLLDSDSESEIQMELLSGKKVKDVLTSKTAKKICSDLGKKLAQLHGLNIIHGDLTTSNMIFNKEVYLIDFGLSFFSHKIEDKAVDLHLLKEALASTHYDIWQDCYDLVLKEYLSSSEDGAAVMKRLETVEKRGRYRSKRG